MAAMAIAVAVGRGMSSPLEGAAIGSMVLPLYVPRQAYPASRPRCDAGPVSQFAGGRGKRSVNRLSNGRRRAGAGRRLCRTVVPAVLEVNAQWKESGKFEGKHHHVFKKWRLWVCP